MDGRCVGRNQRVELAEAVGDRTPVEAGVEFAGFRIDVINIADVAVINLLVVVILDLHDLVAWRKGPSEPFPPALDRRVQRRRSDRAALRFRFPSG